jgi:alanyl aminopeptidase
MLAGILALVLAACAADKEPTTPDNADPFRLSPGIRPVAQTLTLHIDPENTDYSGATTIAVQLAEESASIRLHAKDMQITSLSLVANDRAIEVTHESGEHGLLTIASAEPFAPGDYKLQIAFSNNFNDDGVGINRTEQEGQHYIFSQFEAIDARQAFPCFDEPGFKFPWQMTMVVPTGVTPITNAPVVSVTEKDGQQTVVFDTTPALPSYLIAVAVGPFEFVPIEGMSVPGNVVVPQGKSHLAATAVETTPPLLAFLEDYFGEPYPFKKLDLIATNQAFSGAMEHPGAITYSDFFLLLDENASAAQKSLLIKITAHELAHQWFGNLVTMQWWDDLWLNESFADWMGDKTAVAVYPDFAIELPELRSLFRVMDMDARATTKPIRHDFKSTDNFEDGVVLSYYKGKAVLGMFEEAVGADVFRDGVVRYLRKYSRGNAAADDLWAEINAGAEFDLAGGLAGFVNQPGIPLLSVTDKGEGRFEFGQSRLLPGAESGDASRWVLPMQYKYALGDRVVTAALVVDDPVELVQLDADVAWILPSADQRGYYRWSIPDEMLLRLGADAATHLNVRERMGLLTNLWALLAADKLDGDTYLGAMHGVANDSDPAVINALLDQLGNVQATLITPELREPFAGFLRELLSPTLARIGTDSVPGEDSAVTELRAQVLLWLADYGRDQAARALITSLADQYVAGDIPATDLAAVALRTAARWGTSETFEAYRERFEPLLETSPGDRRNFVRAIGSFRDPEVVQQVLDYALSGKLQPVDISTVLARLAGWEDNLPLLLDWAMENDARLRERLPGGSMADAPAMLCGCSTDNLETIAGFYGAKERFVAGIDGEIEAALANARECATLRQRELDSVRSFLSGP